MARSSSSSRPDTCTCSRPGESQPTRLKIGVADRRREARPASPRGRSTSANVSVSPSGSRAVVEFRGEIVTVPAEKGDPRNLTNIARRPRAQPRPGRRTARPSPTSPTTAASINSSSPRRTARAKRRTITLDGSGFYSDPVWSRDSKKLLYRDNSDSALLARCRIGSNHAASSSRKMASAAG